MTKGETEEIRSNEIREEEIYFTEIYNDLAMTKGETEEIRSNEIREEEIPTYQEYMEVVKHLQSNKAAGPDDINIKLLKDMDSMDVPAKLIRLTKMKLLNGEIQCHKDDNGEIQCQKRRAGKNHHAAVDQVIKNAGLERTIMQTSTQIIGYATQIIGYADDLALVIRDKRTLEEATLCLEREAKVRGLIINGQKTKYMTSSRKQDRWDYLRVSGYNFQRVEHFKYLGVSINGKNNRDVEIDERKLLKDMDSMDVPAKLIRLTKMTMEKSNAKFTSNHLKILSRENVGVKISKFSTKTPLCIIDGTLNSAQYCKILNGFLETAHVLYPEGGRIVQDTSTYSTAWMPEQSLVTIPLGAGNGIVTRL
ncbi:Reverse transcriptase (RNA-dependent DNA polymerase) [Popillia japonica]|uniref:Reverse transcriptase (RNA-dependent DNA polymerase) n=1 Tax=Popillia japonica TaxID=7064 RepID=A0AAW1LS13_POPJA